MMIGKDSYDQIPIPENLSGVLLSAEHRWETQRRYRTKKLAAVACAAFVVGAGISVMMHFQGNIAANPGAVGSPPASSITPSEKHEARIDTEAAAGHETTYSFLPTYHGEIQTQPAEIEPHSELEALIISYLEIPQDSLESTSYFYNYVDLNDDGTDEIFVDLVGMYTSGTGGDTALIVSQEGGSLSILQKLTLVNLPVIVSDSVTNGWHDLIFPYTGGGAESSYMVSSHSGTEYPNVADGKAVSSIDEVIGTSILYTDLTAPDCPRLTLS